MVVFENVGLSYGGPEILRNLSFALEAGSFHFLTGPSGSGKTSLLRLIHMALKPTQGTIRLFGRDTASLKRRELPALRRRIGVVLQDFSLIDHLTVIENVALPLRLAGQPEEQALDHVAELLRWVGLGDCLHTKPTELSGGQQQRVAIARAVINRPALLLADEPTGNVDDDIGYRLLQLFVELNRLGTTVLIATHNHQLMDRIGRPRLVIADGALREAA